jgi:hypothetical protein
VSPRATGLPQNRLNPPTTDVSGIVGPLAIIHIALGSRAGFSFAVGADVDLAPRRYLVEAGSNVDVVFQPWVVRPTFLVGFDFTLVGAPMFPPRSAP